MKRQFLVVAWMAISVMKSLAQEAGGVELENTILYGDYLEMRSGDKLSEFHLTGNVSVLATNLELSSDELYIVAEKKGDKDATVTEMGKITKFTATGNVKIKQEGRTAEAGHAEFMPEEKTVVLTINPVVTDQGRRVSGERITWSHGDRRAQVEGGDENRVKVTLPSMPDLGYDPSAESGNSDSSEEEAETENGQTTQSNP